jgi:hypothetical protein
MPPHPRELDSEVEITYWRDRVSSLEVLVGEMIGISVRDRMCSINSLGREAFSTERPMSAALVKRYGLFRQIMPCCRTFVSAQIVSRTRFCP